MIINEQNQFVKWTMTDEAEANKYGIKLKEAANQARDLVLSLDSTNDLTFLRITCKKYEMMVAPDKGTDSRYAF